MSVRKYDVYQLFDRLNENDQKTVYDFMQYLAHRSNEVPEAWRKIEESEPDDEPLTEEEKQQLSSEDEYVDWEQAKRELGL
ncbi:hypothetical protein LSG31_18555 [Fodinisporobacter ferrooxydans]|uniref:XRE family transcriptional regulator n=1 Tax=Fodinisporobacter ferrooxydans TaxID=2901836 RepID=A0ABY4CL14_9BACL|nr:hypothetical protein LSG31_18555 [Alicyclobacillaceae bacterium MYW30-H2]